MKYLSLSWHQLLMSFGMIGEPSAPGQIDVAQLKQFLKTVQPQ